MKKSALFLLILALLLTMPTFCISAEELTVYAPDGRQQIITSDDLDAWVNVGWFAKPPITVYAPDGRQQFINPDDLDAWVNVGWFAKPPITVYSLDGRQQFINPDDLDAWVNVGWFAKPPITVYSLDGRQQFINPDDLNAWINVGWYKEPPVTVYSADGKSLAIPSAKIKEYKAAGWYYDITMYHPDGSVKTILYPEFKTWSSRGWYTEPVTYMYTKNDKSIIIPNSQIEKYKKSGWLTPSEYSNYVLEKNRASVEEQCKKIVKSKVSRPATVNFESISIVREASTNRIYALIYFEAANSYGIYSSGWAHIYFDPSGSKVLEQKVYYEEASAPKYKVTIKRK